MTSHRTLIPLLTLAVLFVLGAEAQAEKPATDHGKPVPIPTLGGKQFWADELFFHQWHIQQNVLTGHCRLLDGHNRRHAWGSFFQCRAKLDQIKLARKIPPMQGKAVVVLHGLFRSRSSMNRLCEYLEEHGGYTVLNVGYLSTQREVSSHAQALGRILENLDGVEEINFVGHSMGNIVIRHYLADRRKRKPSAGLRPTKVNRFVMLGPPNHGSLAALALAENAAFKVLSGKSGQQLGAEWAKLKDKVATPDCQFGIIAGGKGDGKGFNPLLPGDDDGTITTASTRLAGARDFAVVPVLHSFIMDNPMVHEYVLRFLQNGHFVCTKKQRPIEMKDERRAVKVKDE